MLPPKQLYHPVLPYSSHGKLKFPLCRTCAENETQTKCLCTDAQRMITGTYCTPEIQKAIEKGYKLIKIYEVYHFPTTEQYDPDTKSGGMFTEYINTFLKIKQESSGWPDWIKTDEDKIGYINSYWEHEGIRLDHSNIEKNKGKRALSKLCLNSFWGKFGQKQNMRQTTYFHESQEDQFFQMVSDSTKKVTNCHVISKDMLIMEWEHNKEYVPDDTKSNVFIAAFTTCWARLKLYSILEMLGERVLYMDTDSCIYISKAGLVEPQLGDYLGELTNELNPGEHIVEFVSTGPKSYAYLTNKGTQECKVRGFSLKNYTNSKLVNFDVLKQIITRDQSKSVEVLNDRKICRNKKSSILYNRRERKCYKMVFTKRVIGDNYNTFPYGF